LQEGWPEDKRRQVRKLQLIRIMEECRALEKTPEARRTKWEKERCQVLNIVGEKLFNQVL
jgi:flagellar motility protein MotE (MotC chaperone)